MELVKRGGAYVAVSEYAERHIPKAAGFRWDPAKRHWWTDKVEVAARLREYAAPDVLAGLPGAPIPSGPTLRASGEGFVFSSDGMGHNGLAKAAGFRWLPTKGGWFTEDPEAAARLIEHADEATANELRDAMRLREAARAASRAVDADDAIPCPAGLAYLPCQRGGIAYARRRFEALAGREGGVIIGDEMGLGKTIQAIGIVNADPAIRDVLVTCPATLKLNWRREIMKWTTRPAWVGLCSTTELPEPDPQAAVRFWVCHYDVFSRATRVADALRARTWDLLVCDEAHLLKNPKAGRTRFVLGSKRRGSEEEPIAAARKAFLTGTPMVNRPVELWPLASAAGPDVFQDFFAYARRYCDARQTSRGWDFTGASNLDELQDKLRGTIMVRRLKADVLTELPAKVRQVIELPANGAAPVIAREAEIVAAQEERVAALRAAVELAKASEDPADYTAAVEALRKGMAVAFTEISRVRHETAIAKLPYVAEHVRAAAEDAKVIVFAHHTDVIKGLCEALAEFRPVHIDGGVPLAERQAAVDAFQSDPGVRVFVGQMTAAGVGITLTASSHVVFAELDWVPGNLSQCEDRAHRIGQRESVLVQHLVLEGSIDARMAEVVLDKQRVLDRAMDKDTADAREAREARLRKAMDEAEARVREESDGFALAERIRAARERAAEEAGGRRVVEIGGEAATQDATRDALAAEGAAMTPAQVAAVHAALRMLAGMDQDFARVRNDAGFNRLDGRIGHSLAERAALSPKQAALGRRLVRKYRRQIGPALLAATGVDA